MARYNFSEADNYGQSNSGSFFALKDDGDTARVRFLYGTIDDVEGDVVHEVEVDGKRRYINCLRSYNEPIDKCPLCAAQFKQIPKLFIKLYNEDTNEVQIWERGKTYFQKMANLASHYNPLHNAVIEVTRNGKKGDMKTTYDFFPIETSEFDITSVEIPDALGTIILDKTASDMQDYLNMGGFSSGTDAVSSQRSDITRRNPGNTSSGRRAF